MPLNDPHSGPKVTKVFGVPVLLPDVALGAELSVPDQRLPDTPPPADRTEAAAQDAAFEAEMDNLPL